MLNNLKAGVVARALAMSVYIFFTFLLFSCALQAAPLQLQKIQIASVNETTELQFDFSALPHPKLIILKEPERIVLDFEKAALLTHLPVLSSSILYLKKISTPSMKTQKLRVILEFNQAIQYKTTLKKTGKQPYRYTLIVSPRLPPLPAAPLDKESSITMEEAKKLNIVKASEIKKVVQPREEISIQNTEEIKAQAATVSLKKPDSKKEVVLEKKNSSPPVTEESIEKVSVVVTPAFVEPIKSPVMKMSSNEKWQDLVVVLDPGHGGKDSGAKGKQGTQEKEVVLAIGLMLQKELQAIRGLKVYMTRSTDVFIPLRERLSIARQHKADLFIALHADAFKNSSARGASVFALSQRGATSEGAHWLAEKENESEMLGGADLSDKDHMLKSVLIDMSQTVTINSSILLGQDILDRFQSFTLLHSHKVEQAAFVVLKSPDIPSLLIENGFISNLQEENNLRSPGYQEKLAKEIKQGVMTYFIENAPVNSVFYQDYQAQKK
jgi:N-acetylmuramoyl-L-alanine amidase